jgi:hypothetical protein
VTDLRPTIIPKSDQLNADDLIGRTMTIKVTKVSLTDGDQPVSIHFEGDNDKPYKPGKSMRRVLVQIWGADGNTFIGRRMTLYRDDTVKFGGEEVGGIRISHMSDIDRVITMALTATRAKRKPFTVYPLPADDADDLRAAGREAAQQGEAELLAWWKSLSRKQQAPLKAFLDAELKPLAQGAIGASGHQPASEPEESAPEPSEADSDTFDEEEVDVPATRQPDEAPGGAQVKLEQEADELERLLRRQTDTDSLQAAWANSAARRKEMKQKIPQRYAALDHAFDALYEGLT